MIESINLRKHAPVLVVALLLAVAGFVWWLQRPAPSSALAVDLPAADVEPIAQSTERPSATAAPLLGVDVIGAVAQPGVYFLPANARVQDAVEAAGGLAPNADRNGINLSAHLVDAQQIRVPRVGEKAAVAATTALADDQQGRVNINTADPKALAELPGIGEALAQRIADYRTEHGPFATVNDLQNVKGIGSAVFEKLKPHLRVDDQP